MDQAAELITLHMESANPEKACHLMRFFKTNPGQYGHGDQFLGISVSLARSLIKPFIGKLTLEEFSRLLDSPWHEIRFAALLLMVESAKQKLKSCDLTGLEKLVTFYDKRLERANNWDLIDLSAPNIMGAFWSCAKSEKEQRHNLLKKWASSGNLWRERASMVSTLALIRRSILEDTFQMAEYFINHPHDLMHKAAGWMLREAGKQNLDALRDFLTRFYNRLPRTTLRYAIERMAPDERKKWMKK